MSCAKLGGECAVCCVCFLLPTKVKLALVPFAAITFIVVGILSVVGIVPFGVVGGSVLIGSGVVLFMLLSGISSSTALEYPSASYS